MGFYNKLVSVFVLNPRGQTGNPTPLDVLTYGGASKAIANLSGGAPMGILGPPPAGFVYRLQMVNFSSATVTSGQLGVCVAQLVGVGSGAVFCSLPAINQSFYFGGQIVAEGLNATVFGGPAATECVLTYDTVVAPVFL